MQIDASTHCPIEGADHPKLHDKLSRPQPSKSGTSTLKKIGSYWYDTGDEIGRGYSSIVYKGTNCRTQQDCAVKVVDLQDCSDSTLKMQ